MLYKDVSKRLDAMATNLKKIEKSFLKNSNLVKRQIVNSNPKYTHYITEISDYEANVLVFFGEINDIIKCLREKSIDAFDTPKKREKKNNTDTEEGN